MKNIVLIILLTNLLLFIANFIVYKKKKETKIIKITKVKNILPLLEKLSRDMNHQVIILETITNERIMKLIKYQSLNLWGVKILLEISDKEKFINLLHYPEALTYYLEKENLIIDVGNNLTNLIGVIDAILTNVCNLNTNTIINCFFEKKSIYLMEQ